MRVSDCLLTDEVQPEILFEDAKRPNRVSAGRAGLLEFPRIVENTLSAESVKALFESDWVLEDIQSYGT